MISAQRIRLDRASAASHDLNRLLDEPGPGVGEDYENSFWGFGAGKARREGRAERKRLRRPGKTRMRREFGLKASLRSERRSQRLGTLIARDGL